jgi:hypothetical protein
MSFMNNMKVLFGSLNVVNNLFGVNRFGIITRFRNKSLTLSLTVLGLIGTTSVYLPEANAAPDPVFSPILQDIRDKLPRGMVMRLPSVLRLYDYQGQKITVYPDAEQRNRDELSVILYSQPNCGGGRGGRSCFFGRLSVSQNLTEFENNLISNPISKETQRGYPNRICGIVTRRNLALNSITQAISVDYDTCGASSGRSNYIIWKQDGLFFLVTAGSEARNTDIATSMANEPPIYDSSNTLRQNITNSSERKCLLFTGNGWANVYETLSDAKSPSGIRRFSFTLGFNDIVEILNMDEQNKYLRVTPVQGSFRGIEKINNMFGWLNLSRNSALEQVTCPVKYTTIPSVSPSFTPVKQTDTIAKYPTNKNFNAFEDKLQGNPESLVKLRGNQSEQRRKFQNDWKARNPNAAKFLGAWYTGDRYFYVFPSTVKGGTCVVTQDANRKLNMQIGTVLNQELRYGGGKGLFWRDRPNIIASRDSGSGNLYPIYATSGMPELSESMIGDMERQKCIATLPS